MEIKTGIASDEVVRALAQEVDPDDLAELTPPMGPVARMGISGAIMGNTAKSILLSVGCSVLTIKPEGLETPVRWAERRSGSRP